jgi:hypothetical protein
MKNPQNIPEEAQFEGERSITLLYPFWKRVSNSDIELFGEIFLPWGQSLRPLN